ncbi:uncharacterized protein Z519_09498 [Cladophialophora bantiana CBS 173.52]|uniref:Cytochrome P450 n=1 Tax=Cladophialophora bantiana (strain ATCC 10958 / CBS 173.52 / CDC B-1940 / NIH 8579) TaxID=1442370 RepID=A0A0D2FU56_CLAB1|nr:uncharacterized protein Z519_09498 [Cladophialophora bantiana CBS 173.52]KIW90067.1 hypothetical protein Z519_09498 [Cladophialophora bantiana CBS 173.52]
MVPLFAVGACIGLLVVFKVVSSWRRPPLPPGPKGRWPLLGMTFDMPPEKPWETMASWAREYGPLVYFRVGLQHFILISDGLIAREFLDKRSGQYSSRPPSEVGDLISGGLRSVLMPYGNRWRAIRRIFANVLTSKKCDSYLRIQEGEALVTIYRIQEDPTAFADEVHRYSLSVARSIAFGKRVQSSADPFAVQVKKLMEQFADAMTPGKYLFEAIPTLRKLPRSMQPWLSELEQFRDYEHNFSLMNYREALDYAEKHPDRPCIARDIHKEMKETGEVNELQAATTCMEILGAGSDTTANSLLFVILACIAHPDVQKTAHEELDRVIGQGRFPTWEDEPNLPYIRAIIKEQHRWRSIAPMSFSHWSDREDVYNGYRIPKNAVVRVNTWAIHQDPARYLNPETFMPERFLDFNLSAAAYANSPDVAARDHFSYGGGKRICVGLHLAERSLFNMTARLLHAFEMLPALDVSGREIPIDPNDVKTALIMAPNKFSAQFQLRGEKIAETLEREWREKVGGVGESWS